MPDLEDHHAPWIGQTLTDASGHRIGKIEDIHTDDDTGQPEWLAVSAGLRGPYPYFVPMRGATASGRGVQVPFPKDQVKRASSSTADGTLSRLVKGRLYAHYGCSYAEERNLLQRTLGFDPPGVSPSPDGRVVGMALALLDEGCPAELRELTGPAEVGDLSDPTTPGDMSPPTDQRDLSPADLRDLTSPADLRESACPADLREVSRPADLPEAACPADQREVSRPADVPDLRGSGSPGDVGRLADRLDEGEPLPPAGRGRWPDDEAIFGLSTPMLASSGAARGR